MSSRHLRAFDAFAKPVEGTRTRTVAGGAITALSYAAAGVLFLCQVYLYVVGETRHSLTLAESVSTEYLGAAGWVPLDGGRGKYAAGRTANNEAEHRKLKRIPLELHVTFPHIKCADLDFGHDGALKSDAMFIKAHGMNAFRTTPPTRREFETALGMEPGTFDPRRHKTSDGCTVKGKIQVPRVGGSLSVTVSRKAWQRATAFLTFGMGPGGMDGGNSPHLPNCTHYIHSISFGKPFPLSHNPLVDSSHIITNESGVALNNIVAKLVPTEYVRSFLMGGTMQTYQASVTQHIVQPQTLAAQRSGMLPGLAVAYDFSPLAVKHVEARDGFLVFLGSLVSIVGGVFVTVGLVTGCLVDSAKAVAKKVD